MKFPFLIDIFFPMKPVVRQSYWRNVALRAVQTRHFSRQSTATVTRIARDQRHHLSSPFRHYRSVFVLTSVAYAVPRRLVCHVIAYVRTCTHTFYMERKNAPLEFISRRSRGCTIAPFHGTRGLTSRFRFGRSSSVFLLSISLALLYTEPSMSMFTVAQLSVRYDHFTLRDAPFVGWSLHSINNTAYK